MLELIAQSNPYSIQSAIIQLSVLRKYIDFAITKGYLRWDTNAADFIKLSDVKGVLNDDEIRLKYLTKDELTEIANSLTMLYKK